MVQWWYPMFNVSFPLSPAYQEIRIKGDRPYNSELREMTGASKNLIFMIGEGVSGHGLI